MGNDSVKHPKGLYACGLVFTCERFAYYGSKSLLLLFLATAVAEGGLGLDAADAAVIGANLMAFTYLAPVIGGVISDRWLGARYCVVIGALIMAGGWFIGYFATSVMHVHALIAVVSIGTGLFKNQLNAMVGELYTDASQKDSAFSILYSFVNVGSFFGSLILAYLCANTFATEVNGTLVQGFQKCFALSGVMMLVATVVSVLGWRVLGDAGKLPQKMLSHGDEGQKVLSAEEANRALTSDEKKRVIAITIISAFTIIFWTAYYQASTSVLLYMNTYVNMNVGSFAVPPVWIETTLNGLLCILLGPVMAAIWSKLSNRPQGDLTMIQKVSLGFIFLGVAFVFMVGAEFTRGVGAPETAKASVVWLIGFTVFQTIGEMCFSPLGNSMVSKHAPAKYLTVLMGVWTLATFAASKASGYVQGIMESMGMMQVFIAIPVILIVSAVLLLVFDKKLEAMLTAGQK